MNHLQPRMVGVCEVIGRSPAHDHAVVERVVTVGAQDEVGATGRGRRRIGSERRRGSRGSSRAAATRTRRRLQLITLVRPVLGRGQPGHARHPLRLLRGSLPLLLESAACGSGAFESLGGSPSSHRSEAMVGREHETTPALEVASGCVRLDDVRLVTHEEGEDELQRPAAGAAHAGGERLEVAGRPCLSRAPRGEPIRCSSWSSRSTDTDHVGLAEHGRRRPARCGVVDRRRVREGPGGPGRPPPKLERKIVSVSRMVPSEHAPAPNRRPVGRLLADRDLSEGRGLSPDRPRRGTRARGMPPRGAGGRPLCTHRNFSTALQTQRPGPSARSCARPSGSGNAAPRADTSHATS